LPGARRKGVARQPSRLSRRRASVRNEIMTRVTDYKFWAGQTISHFHPLGLFQYTLLPVRYFHGYNDPTAFHLPILWDNREQPQFKTMEKFRFSDGHAFDFRGEPDRTLPSRRRTLADSNQRFPPTRSPAPTVVS